MLVMTVLAWLPAFVSVVLLIVFWLTDDLPGHRQLLFGAWFLVAAGLQFFTRPPLLPTVGLVLQVLLAITLVARTHLR